MIELLVPSIWPVGLFYFVFGACVGSFLNVVSWRLPQIMHEDWRQQCRELLKITTNKNLTNQTNHNLGLLSPRSFCPHCKTPIKPWHNLPIVGYVLLRGHCASCQQKISPRYPLLELITAIITLQVGMKFVDGTSLAVAVNLVMILFLIWCLILLTSIDLECQLLPDSITMPLLWVGLIFNLNSGFTTISSAVIGAIAGYLILWSLYQVHLFISGKEGMGHGDFKLLAALGAWFGWQMLPLIILLASGIGVLLTLILIMSKHLSRDIPFPFGPYLSLAGWICLFWGEYLVNRYLHVLSFV